MPQPSSIYEIHDRFRHLIVGTSDLEELYSGCRWAEGPVWFADLGCLIFSDIPNQRMLRRTEGGGISTYRSPSNFANGNTRGRQCHLRRRTQKPTVHNGNTLPVCRLHCDQRQFSRIDALRPRACRNDLLASQTRYTLIGPCLRMEPVSNY
jgi:hypothetical protein